MDMNSKVRLGILVSGGGSNMQAIVNACATPHLDCAEVKLVVSNRSDAYALDRAKELGIESMLIDPKQFPDRNAFYKKIILEMESRGIGLICLAGFLLKLEPNIIQRFKGRILNIHPALLPKFGGKGMYGHFVHETVIKAKEKETGATVHVVDEEFDHGPIILQKKVPVFPEDDAGKVAARVLQLEHKLFPEAISLYIKEYLRKGKV